MKISIRDIGVVHQTDLKLDGLTVIAGENGVGKSAIGKALYGALQSGSNSANIIEKIMGGIIFNSVVRLTKKSCDPKLQAVMAVVMGKLMMQIQKDDFEGIQPLLESISQKDETVDTSEIERIMKEALQEIELSNAFKYPRQREHDQLIQSIFNNAYNNKLANHPKSTCSISANTEAGERTQTTTVINNSTTVSNEKTVPLK